MATDVTSAVFETLTGSDPTSVSGAVFETLTGSDPTSVSSMVIETLVAEDIASTHVSSMIIETLVAEDAGNIAVSAMIIETLIGRVPAPLDVIRLGPPSIDEQRFGRDLVLELPRQDEEAGVVPSTATGDWPALAGRPNLHAALRRRMITVPGQVVHRADYGGGLPLYVGRLNTPQGRSELANTSRANVLRDDRVAEARVAASEIDDYPDAVLVELSVTARGDTEPATVSILSEE